MSVAKNIIFAILIASICGVVFAGYISDMAQTTGLKADDASVNSTYDKISEMENLTNSMQKQVDEAKLDSTNVFGITTEGAFKSIKLVSSSIGFVTGILGSVATELGLPTWVLTLAITFMTITITVLILGAFLRWKT